MEAAAPMTHPQDHVSSLEANSGGAFVRKLALGMDPYDAPRMHLFAWNTFLGSRESGLVPRIQCITDLLTETDMKVLASAYFEKVGRCYGFIDRSEFEHNVRSRWATPGGDRPYDAVLFGVVALGSLFSSIQATTVEISSVASAKIMLEAAQNEIPSVTVVTAWVLRVAYLRMAGTPHVAWMASSTLMHMIEAAGLHCERSEKSILHSSEEEVDPDIRRRIFGVALHLNTWISFDIGRTRVMLHNATKVLPSTYPGSYTVEIVKLLAYSSLLDPDKAPDAGELEATLVEILATDTSEQPHILAQCNLVLCICRRLKLIGIVLQGQLLEQVLSLTMKAIQAARTVADRSCPWHHMVNIPFQIVCILLVIDTTASISQLRHAISCLSSIASIYNTEATQEALRTASLLVLLHKRRKDRCISILGDILKQFPVAGLTDSHNVPGTQPIEEIKWLDGLVAEMPGLQEFDFDINVGQDFNWFPNSGVF
jgi:hypothetical protein